MLTSAANSGIINASVGNSNVKIGDTDGMTKITDVKFIDFNDKTAIEKELYDFAEKYAYADVEYSLTISPDNRVYLLQGKEKAVNTGLLESDILKQSISIHNHTVQINEYMADSFSFDDLDYANYYHAGKQYLTSGERREAFEFTQYHTTDEVTQAWANSQRLMWENHVNNNTEVIFEHEEILRNLNLFLEGFEFYENF